MTIDFEQKRIEVIKAEANLMEVDFPPCCISCDNYSEYENATIPSCTKLQIVIDNPFQICNYYSD